jgi:polyisoprenoid-binding protein YceI
VSATNTMAQLSTYTIDPTHSFIEFAVTYSTNSIVKGRFTDFSGTIQLDPEQPENSKLTAEIDTTSVTTSLDDRDEHLRSDEFLSVDAYPEMRFESGDIDVVDGNHWLINGDLEIRGIQNPVTLDTRYFETVEDAFGVTRAGFIAETELARSDWSVNWNRELDNGGFAISDRVKVVLYITARPEDSGEDED